MRENKISVLFGLFLALGVASCSKKGDSEANLETEVQSEIQASIDAHESASSLDEWVESGKTFHDLFEKLRSSTPEEITAFCDSLVNLDVKTRALFYEEITDLENQKIIPCLKSHISELDSFFIAEDARLERAIQEQSELEKKIDAEIDLEVNGDFSTPLKSFPRQIEVNDEKESTTSEAEPRILVPNDDGDDGAFSIVKRLTWEHSRLMFAGMERGPKNCEVALTFDDGPSVSVTPEILEILADAGAKATFFMVGQLMERGKVQIQRMVEDGHRIGNHSWNHTDLRKLSFASARDNQIEKTQSLLNRIHLELFQTELDYRYFRFPYGAATSGLRDYLRQAEYFDYFWAMDSLDWKYKNDSVTLWNKVMSELNRAKGGVILFHDIHRINVSIIPRFLEELKKRQCKLVVFDTQI